MQVMLLMLGNVSFSQKSVEILTVLDLKTESAFAVLTGFSKIGQEFVSWLTPNVEPTMTLDNVYLVTMGTFFRIRNVITPVHQIMQSLTVNFLTLWASVVGASTDIT